MKENRFERKLSDDKYSKDTEIERTSKKFFRSMVPTENPGHVLDVGCATGVHAKFLSEVGYTVSGIDISPVAIERYREAGFDGRVGDLNEELPFDNDAFDLVFASDVIEHLVNTDFFLSEIYRVTCPGGTMMLSTTNSAFWAFRLLTLIGKTPTDFQHPGHLRFFSPKSLERAVIKAGFSPPEMYSRQMFFIVGEGWAGPFESILNSLHIFNSEMRYLTNRPFWHISRFARGASSLWSDSLMLVTKKM